MRVGEGEGVTGCLADELLRVRCGALGDLLHSQGAQRAERCHTAEDGRGAKRLSEGGVGGGAPGLLKGCGCEVPSELTLARSAQSSMRSLLRLSSMGEDYVNEGVEVEGGDVMMLGV